MKIVGEGVKANGEGPTIRNVLEETLIFIKS